MSILTQLPAIPTVHNGYAVDATELGAAIAYLSAIHGADMVTVTWESTKKTLVAFDNDVIKSHGTATVGRGMEHKNLNGGVTGEMKWGEWLLFPWVKIHKGHLYARLYPVMSTVEMTYSKNGETITHDDYKTMVPKRKPSAKPIETIDVKILSLTVTA
jgi:hypothetical protein